MSPKNGHVAAPLLPSFGPDGKLLIVEQTNSINCPCLMLEGFQHAHVLQVFDSIVQSVAIEVAHQPLRGDLLHNRPKSSGGSSTCCRVAILVHLQHF